MTIEDQIRTALRDDAGAASLPPDGWDDVRARADAHKRRRRAIRYPVAGLVAAAAIAAIVVGVAALRSTSESEAPSIATPSGARMPEEIAAIVNDRLVVLDSETGAEVRTLTEGARGQISTGGNYAYFVRQDDRDCAPATFEVARVPLDGGPVEVVARGLAPRVSPDGRWLAYTSYGEGEFPNCVPERLLVVRDLTTGDERQYFVPGDSGGAPLRAVALSWTPDSRRVLYGTSTAPETTYLLLDNESESGALDESNSIPVSIRGDTVPIGIGPDGSLLVRRASTTNELGFIDPVTGEFTNSILKLRDRDVLSASLDPSGRHIVYATVSASAPALPLERITIGHDDPVVLETSAYSVAWAPATESAPPPAPTTTPETTPAAPTSTTAPASPSIGPETIVAVTADGRVVELDAGTGAERRVIRSAPDDGLPYETVSVGPDGSIATSNVNVTDDYCQTFDTGQIEFGNRTHIESVGQGRYPAISPDGKRIAWVGVQDCVTVLRVHDLESGADSVLTAPPAADGGPDPQLSGPLAWAPDSKHLMVPMNVEPSREWWYVDADAPDGSLSGPIFRKGGEQSGAEVLAFHGDDRVAEIQADPAATDKIQIVEYNPRTSELAVRVDVADIPPGGAMASALAFDEETERFLMVLQIDGQPTLYRLDPERGLVELGSGIRAADW